MFLCPRSIPPPYIEGMSCWLNRFGVEMSLIGRERVCWMNSSWCSWRGGSPLNGSHVSVLLLNDGSVVLWACMLIKAVLAWVLQEQAIRWSPTGHTGDVLCEGLFLVTKVRWFMIYFQITPSLLCVLGPPVNNRYTFPVTSTADASFFCSSQIEKRACTVILTAHLYTFMSCNWNKGRRWWRDKKKN